MRGGLFADEGTTFTVFLLDQRLPLAHRMWTDSRVTDCSISQISFDCGFGDLSYFN
jgi:AraC-like DNA-binding protein